MAGGLYSFLCVHRGNLVESIRQYSSDEDDFSLSRRLIWPDRGDGKSFVSREDYLSSDDEFDPLSIVRPHEEVLRRVREAALAPPPIRSTLTYEVQKRRQKEAESVVHFDDDDDEDAHEVVHENPSHYHLAGFAENEEDEAYEEEVVEAHGELLLSKAVPEDSGIDLGYDAEDEDYDPSGITTPQRRSPKKYKKEPPEMNRGYVAESSVTVYQSSPVKESHPSLLSSDTRESRKRVRSPSQDPRTPCKARSFSLSLPGTLSEGEELGDDKENVHPRTIRSPISDNTMIGRRQCFIYQRGTQSCPLDDDPCNPFRPTPRSANNVQQHLLETQARLGFMTSEVKHELPIVDETSRHAALSPSLFKANVDPSILEEMFNEEDEDNVNNTYQFTLPASSANTSQVIVSGDFNFCPTIPSFQFGQFSSGDSNDSDITFQKNGDEQPTVSAPPSPPTTSLPKHALYDGSEDDENDNGDSQQHDAKRHRSTYEAVGDFGASILAARPLGTLQSPPSTALDNQQAFYSQQYSDDEDDTSAPTLGMDFGASILAARPLGALRTSDNVSNDKVAINEPVLDFGASILAARPLGALRTSDNVSNDNVATNDPALDFGASILAARPMGTLRTDSYSGGGNHDTKQQVPPASSKTVASDFGASIIATRPLGTLRLPDNNIMPQPATNMFATDFGAGILASRPLGSLRPPMDPTN